MDTDNLAKPRASFHLLDEGVKDIQKDDDLCPRIIQNISQFISLEHKVSRYRDCSDLDDAVKCDDALG